MEVDDRGRCDKLCAYFMSRFYKVELIQSNLVNSCLIWKQRVQFELGMKASSKFYFQSQAYCLEILLALELALFHEICVIRSLENPRILREKKSSNAFHF